MKACSGRILYTDLISAALEGARVQLRSAERSGAVLVWWDTIDDRIDYFSASALRPWQVVNRLPGVNLICRKAGLARMIERVPRSLAGHFQFWPRTFVLPADMARFTAEFESERRPTYILKPDGGSLGCGIRIVRPGERVVAPGALTIAQEYVQARLLGGRKFDLRVYVLVAQVDPLKIYVCRDGIARICSRAYAAGTDRFSQITNTAVNRQNADVAITDITRMISDVFAELRQAGVEPELLWRRIDYAVVCTIAAAYGFLLDGEQRLCPPQPYPRCFQILGFDVLLDTEMRVHVLEVNYRPSLGSDIQPERELKLRMLREAVQIAVPRAKAQQRVNELPRLPRDKKDDRWNQDFNKPEKAMELTDAFTPMLFKQVFPQGSYDLTVRSICDAVKKIGVALVDGLPGGLGLPALAVSESSLRPAAPAPAAAPSRGLPRLS